MPPPPLITAPGAAAFWGVGWFQAILNDLQIDDKDISHRIWLDCDDAAGQAATALNVGCQKLVFTGTGPALQTLINLAADQGAEVRQDRFDTFDLRQIDFNKPTSASLHAAKQKLRNWLQTS